MIINKHELEFINDEHIYLIDGLIVPSVTQIIHKKFPTKYSNVNPNVLEQAAIKGTEMHAAIENYCKNGTESNLKELRNFKFLQRMYQFKVVDNEIPVILYKNGKPAAAGRLDMVIEINGELGLADLKRTSVLDKNYLAYQLNIYKKAYEQTYGGEIKFLRGIHLREDKRKFVTIPIMENLVKEIMEEIWI